MRFTESEFIDAITLYEKMYREEDQIINAMDINPEWVPGEWISNYYNIIREMCDFAEEDYDTALEFYCYELDFGKEWTLGRYIVDGKDVPLRDPYDLWAAITGQKW